MENRCSFSFFLEGVAVHVNILKNKKRNILQVNTLPGMLYGNKRGPHFLLMANATEKFDFLELKVFQD